MPVPAIILAAGASRRLGQPKQLVRTGEETLLDRTIRVAGEAGAEPIFVVLGANLDAICSNARLAQVQIVPNVEWEQGISSSIRAGVLALVQMLPSPRAVLMLVCDQPLLSAEHLKGLIAKHLNSPEETIVASDYTQLAGIPAIFPVSQFPALLQLQGDRGARSLLRDPAVPCITVPFPAGELDIDTPADLLNLSPK